jgi:vacuolar protein sorting-associated protein 54
MANLVKETTTLYKVLSKYLPPDSLKSILNEVFRAYVRRLEEELRRIDLFSSAAKNRLLIEVQYLIAQLSSLDGVDGPGNHLEVCVNNIKIKDKRTYVSAVPRGSISPASGVPPGKQPPVPPAPPLAKNNLSAFANNFGYYMLTTAKY